MHSIGCGYFACWENRKLPCKKSQGTAWKSSYEMLDEFRGPEVTTQAVEDIRRRADAIRHDRTMEVCGGHTHAICSFGLKNVLPATQRRARKQESPIFLEKILTLIRRRCVPIGKRSAHHPKKTRDR